MVATASRPQARTTNPPSRPGRRPARDASKARGLGPRARGPNAAAQEGRIRHARRGCVHAGRHRSFQVGAEQAVPPGGPELAGWRRIARESDSDRVPSVQAAGAVRHGRRRKVRKAARASRTTLPSRRCASSGACPRPLPRRRRARWLSRFARLGTGGSGSARHGRGRRRTGVIRAPARGRQGFGQGGLGVGTDQRRKGDRQACARAATTSVRTRPGMEAGVVARSREARAGCAGMVSTLVRDGRRQDLGVHAPDLDRLVEHQRRQDAPDRGSRSAPAADPGRASGH